MALSIGTATALVWVGLMAIPSCVKRDAQTDEPRPMSNGEASARCAALLERPVVGVWGDEHGWQCRSSIDTWAYCYGGVCRFTYWPLHPVPLP